MNMYTVLRQLPSVFSRQLRWTGFWTESMAEPEPGSDRLFKGENKDSCR